MPNFMMIDTGVQAIISFYFEKFKVCNYSITDGNEL
jgi:hypothetical protein